MSPYHLLTDETEHCQSRGREESKEQREAALTTHVFLSSTLLRILPHPDHIMIDEMEMRKKGNKSGDHLNKWGNPTWSVVICTLLRRFPIRLALIRVLPLVSYVDFHSTMSHPYQVSFIKLKRHVR